MIAVIGALLAGPCLADATGQFDSNRPAHAIAAPAPSSPFKDVAETGGADRLLIQVAANGRLGPPLIVRILSIKADSTTFGIGGDEIFLRANTGERFPPGRGQSHSINDGESWSPNAVFRGEGTIAIELKEWDSISSNDLIGTLIVSANRGPGRFTATLKGGGGVYRVTYELSLGGTPEPAAAPTPQSAAAAPATNRTWAARGNGASITASDCSGNCEEDIGILFECRGTGRPAEVSVPAAATDGGRTGAVLPLRVIVDGSTFSYSAKLGPDGLVGHVPSFLVQPGDPLVSALQAGHGAQVIFGGRSAEISLRGSRDALEIFKAHCGWNGAAASDTGGQQAQAPFVQLSAPDAGDSGARWYNSQFDDQQGRQVSTLTFGIPETDATAFNASCRAGGHDAEVALSLDTGGSSASADAFLLVQGQPFRYRSRPFSASSKSAGVHVTIGLDDPIWRALQNARQPIAYGIVGQTPRRMSARGTGPAVAKFLAACASLAGSAQPTPQGGSPGGGGAYLCDDGSRLQVTITPSGPASIANITHGQFRFALIAVPTKVGEKYSNGVATLNISGTTAQFSASGTNLFCQAN